MTKRKMLGNTDNFLIFNELENRKQKIVIIEKFGILFSTVATIIKIRF